MDALDAILSRRTVPPARMGLPGPGEATLRRLALGTMLVLAGCSLPPEETPDEARLRRTADCRAAGFAPDSSELRLCLLLQQANDRLALLERRLRRIEQDVQFHGSYGRGYGPGWW